MVSQEFKIAISIAREQKESALKKGVALDYLIKRMAEVYGGKNDPDLSEESIAKLFEDEFDESIVAQTAMKIIRAQVMKRFTLPLTSEQVGEFSEPTNEFTSSEIANFFLNLKE